MGESRLMQSNWPEWGKIRAHVKKRPGSVFGSRLRAIRKSKGYTQVWLGARMNMTQQQVAELERGRHTPRMDTLHRLAVALNVSVTDLSGETIVSCEPSAWLAFNAAVENLQRSLDDLKVAVRLLQPLPPVPQRRSHPERQPRDSQARSGQGCGDDR
jgi:transcriptional regulator with XRE-family HTH domain